MELSGLSTSASRSLSESVRFFVSFTSFSALLPPGAPEGASPIRDRKLAPPGPEGATVLAAAVSRFVVHTLSSLSVLSDLSGRRWSPLSVRSWRSLSERSLSLSRAPFGGGRSLRPVRGDVGTGTMARGAEGGKVDLDIEFNEELWGMLGDGGSECSGLSC